MPIGMGNIAGFLLLIAISALAWRRKRNVGGKTWAFRTIPLGLIVLVGPCRCCGSLLAFLCGTLAILISYAIAAYKGGWRLVRPRNRILNGLWWVTHILVYFSLIFFLCASLAGIVGIFVKFSPIATEGDWPWTKGNITDRLPFAVEYKRAKTFCAEYDKRLLFKSGKRVGLPNDTCGFGAFQVYRLKSGEYCLEDGFDRKLPASFGDQSRWLRVNVENETVELKYGIGWFKIPEEGFVCGWGGSGTRLDDFDFDMYPGGDLNKERWSVSVSGTPLGDSLDGRELIGTIDTRGRFNGL